MDLFEFGFKIEKELELKFEGIYSILMLKWLKPWTSFETIWL